MEQPITGIVLAGGSSSRMGVNKALIKLGNMLVVEHVINNLKSVCTEIIISANSSEFDFLGFPVVADIFDGIGPAAGIQAALNYTQTDVNLFVSCDSPFVTPDVLNFLLTDRQDYLAVIPQIGENIEPMIGYYSKLMLPYFNSSFASGVYSPPKILKSASALFKKTEPKMFKHAEFSFLNLNTIFDLQIAINYYNNLLFK